MIRPRHKCGGGGGSDLAELNCTSCGRNFKCIDELSLHEEYCESLIAKKREAEEAGEFEEEPEDEPWLDGGAIEHNARVYAAIGLNYLNQQHPHREYKLVKPGNYQRAGIRLGTITHFNFKAKANDEIVQTFFAQLRIYFHNMEPGDPVLEFCVSLGPSENLPYWDDAYLRDCDFCTHGVHHPRPCGDYDGMEECEEKLILGKF